jgi:hypothetical protein
MAVTSPCRYAMREIEHDGAVVGYAVHQSWTEDGRLVDRVAKVFSAETAGVYTAWSCAKSMVEALNG